MSSMRRQAQVVKVRKKILSWYYENKRDLPWRLQKDPYRIWISETMLQQTQVDTVVPYYNRFIKKFPTVRSLGLAKVDEVLSLWSGLGYYSRARSIHRAARQIIEKHNGSVPKDILQLRALPGVGPYTAGAISAIAFDLPEVAIDGNVTRVISRVYGVREDVTKSHGRKKIASHVQSLMDGPAPGDFCQALMELGAVLCRPRSPHCDKCPATTSCDAFSKGDARALPQKKKKTPPKAVSATAILLSRGKRFLAVKRPERGLLGGLWDFPGGTVLEGEKPEIGLERNLSSSLGLVLRGPVEKHGQIVHLFSHRKMTLHLFSGEIGPQRVRRRDFVDHRWVSLKTFLNLPHSSLTAKMFRSLNLRSPL